MAKTKKKKPVTLCGTCGNVRCECGAITLETSKPQSDDEILTKIIAAFLEMGIRVILTK